MSSYGTFGPRATFMDGNPAKDAAPLQSCQPTDLYFCEVLRPSIYSEVQIVRGL